MLITITNIPQVLCSYKENKNIRTNDYPKSWTLEIWHDSRPQKMTVLKCDKYSYQALNTIIPMPMLRKWKCTCMNGWLHLRIT